MQTQSLAAVSQETGRIKAFDWLRGIAVLVMIQCHALSLLRPELRSGAFFRRLDFVNGLVAPAFILASGFSLALVQVRVAKIPGPRAARILKTLRRILEVLIVATLVNWMWFPIWREPRWIFRIDILHCIGLALLIALPIMVGLARRPTALRWVALLLAGAAFATAPIAERVSGAMASLLNTSTGSIFPLLPWAGYVYLGASLGSVAASTDSRTMARWMVALSVLGLAVWQAGPVFERVYPAHYLSFNDPATHGHRWAIVCLLVLALMTFEHAARKDWQRNGAVRFVQVFGTSSLAAYFFHLALLYYRDLGFSFHARWGDRCGWGKYSILTAALIAITFVLTVATNSLYRAASSLRFRRAPSPHGEAAFNDRR